MSACTNCGIEYAAERDCDTIANQRGVSNEYTYRTLWACERRAKDRALARVTELEAELAEARKPRYRLRYSNYFPVELSEEVFDSEADAEAARKRVDRFVWAVVQVK